MQIIVIIFFVIILFIFLLLSLSSDEDDEDQKRIAGKEGELQAKKILNHYLNENGLLLKYYGVDLWIEGYVLFVNMNSPVESEYTVNDKSEIDDILHLRRNQVLTKNQIQKIIRILK